MSTVAIECPQCAWESNVDESLVGQRVKCPKCEESFVAEAGGAYDLADAPRPAASPPPPDRSPSGRPSRGGDEPAAAEQDMDELLSHMEKWAEE